MSAIRDYEQVLAGAMLKVLKANGAVIYGISDEARLSSACRRSASTSPATRRRISPTRWTRRGIGIRDGHMYAPRLMQRLGLSMDTGCLRVSLVHYNTLDEIERFGKVLARIIAAG